MSDWKLTAAALQRQRHPAPAKHPHSRYPSTTLLRQHGLFASRSLLDALEVAQLAMELSWMLKSYLPPIQRWCCIPGNCIKTASLKIGVSMLSALDGADFNQKPPSLKYAALAHSHDDPRRALEPFDDRAIGPACPLRQPPGNIEGVTNARTDDDERLKCGRRFEGSLPPPAFSPTSRSVHSSPPAARNTSLTLGACAGAARITGSQQSSNAAPTGVCLRIAQHKFRVYLDTPALDSFAYLVLDEIDHLSTSLGILAAVFALPAAHASFLRAVVISNSHTLAARTAGIASLHFQPYDAKVVADIARTHLGAPGGGA
ncbi:hypothetical protein AURDEDRAFT_172678 [Auricularia subglabra TFB-10046 SS5]|nr:hypothetical protein AURDEDRAFT_172678 [Auricularia subglabra TFB-10046 SS5]